MGYEVKVRDEEYLQHSENVNAQTTHIEETLTTMLATLQQVVDGTLEGDTASNFAEFIATAQLLQGKIEALGNTYKALATEYIAEIDACDQYY